jgi:hypothetical protein
MSECTHLKHLLPLHPEVLQQHGLWWAAQLAHQLNPRHLHLLLAWQAWRVLGQPVACSACDAADHLGQLGSMLPSSACSKEKIWCQCRSELLIMAEERSALFLG